LNFSYDVLSTAHLICFWQNLRIESRFRRSRPSLTRDWRRERSRNETNSFLVVSP
jgi:hypothetical protein